MKIITLWLYNHTMMSWDGCKCFLKDEPNSLWKKKQIPTSLENQGLMNNSPPLMIKSFKDRSLLFSIFEQFHTNTSSPALYLKLSLTSSKHQPPPSSLKRWMSPSAPSVPLLWPDAFSSKSWDTYFLLLAQSLLVSKPTPSFLHYCGRLLTRLFTSNLSLQDDSS